METLILEILAWVLSIAGIAIVFCAVVVIAVYINAGIYAKILCDMMDETHESM